MTARDGVVTGAGPIAERPTGPNVTEVDLGKTILMPGFVNAHTHLELSHLQGAVSGDRGFVPWIEEQLRVRAERPADEAGRAIEIAIAAMESSGTVALAEVTNSLVAVRPLMNSRLHALVLHEILGFDPDKALSAVEHARAIRAGAEEILELSRGEPRIRIEIAAHAPHSISRELFRLLMKERGVRSIHVAESRSEREFLGDGGGAWRDFLDRRVGPIPFLAPAKAPVQYLDELGVLSDGLLAVHCVQVDEADARLLAARGALAVLCPRSNEFLGNGVPPLALLLGHGVKIALGTDSLASCPSLDVLEDARLLARRFPRVPPEEIFRALTRQGALALGFPNLGELRPGALAKFAALPFEGTPPSDPIAFVLHDSAPARGLA